MKKQSVIFLSILMAIVLIFTACSSGATAPAPQTSTIAKPQTTATALSPTATPKPSTTTASPATTAKPPATETNVTPAPSATQKAPWTIKFLGSIYVGWMPHYYAMSSGIFAKWAAKYGGKINFEGCIDYISSIDPFVSGQADASVMTNLEALNMPAASGVDTTAIIIGDYSNGNDAVLTRNNLKLSDLKGKAVYLVDLSVSRQLLERGLEMEGNGVKITDLKLMNTSDTDIGPAFITNKNQEVVVTWNPIVMDIQDQVKGLTNAFNSSKIPYEIQDTLFIRTDVLKKNPDIGKALAGAWYETIALMKAGDPKAMTGMAEAAGTTTASLNKQLQTTAMFWTGKEASEFTKSKKLIETMDLIRKFSFSHGLWQNAKTVDDVGILFPDGTILGNKDNIKLRFDATYMQLAADGKLQ